LILSPVSGADLNELQALKADPRVFALMLGGVRRPQDSAVELAENVRAWGAFGFGLWSIREAADGRFAGITGLEHRPDRRGVALRFALWPEAQGRGLAREAAGAALRFGHNEARLQHIVAVARETNFASRTVLGSIGMREAGCFIQGGWQMILFESRAAAGGPGGEVSGIPSLT
jgi:RimJ/RimL family protein N-acetyltransferase